MRGTATTRANALPAAGVLRALPFAFLMAGGGARHAALAALVLAAAIATDLLDGPVARRRGAATASGGAFDHAADCFFVTSGLAAGGVLGVLSYVLPHHLLGALPPTALFDSSLPPTEAPAPASLGPVHATVYF